MTGRSTRGHGYARLALSGWHTYLAPEDGGLLFVDLDVAGEWDNLAAALRTIPPSVIGLSSRIIFRSPSVRWLGPIPGWEHEDDAAVVVPVANGWPPDAADLCDKLTKTLSAHRLPPTPVGLFELPVGADPCMVGTDLADLAICRSAEVEGLLESQGGVWRPKTYHYQLPSGRHATTFVRTADALRATGAARALSSWLRPMLSATTAVYVDSGSLMPLVGELDMLMRLASIKLPVEAGLLGVESVERYPRSRWELQRQLAMMNAEHVLAILSVSSTGRSLEQLTKALDDTTNDWRLECLVERGGQHAYQLPDAAAQRRQEAWLTIEGLDDDVDSAGRCASCSDSKRAAVVHLDPRTFAAMAMPSPTLVMPDFFAACRNASLFDEYESLGPETVLLAGSERSRTRARPYLRPDQPERMRFEPTALLSQPKDDVRKLVADRCRELGSLRKTDANRQVIARALNRLSELQPTIAVVDAEEVGVVAAALGNSASGPEQAKELALERFHEAARGVCPTVSHVAVADLSNDLDNAIEDLTTALEHHDRPLIMSAGLQSGVTFQHLVVAVQDSYVRLGRDPELVGLVVHAHPVDGAGWASVRNSFGGRTNPNLLALWLTYLPFQSPFADELDVLRLIQDTWLNDYRPEVSQLLETRLNWLNPEKSNQQIPAPPSPFLSPKARSLRRTSIYGALSDRLVMPAVGSALTESLNRNRSGGAPEWLAVDMASVLRSYFDGILHAAVIRWVTPERAWWGRTNDCAALLSELMGRFVASDDWQMLLPELLLATAQGKIPDDGAEFVLAAARRELAQPQGSRWPEAVLDYVALTLAAADNLWMRSKA